MESKVERAQTETETDEEHVGPPRTDCPVLFTTHLASDNKTCWFQVGAFGASRCMTDSEHRGKGLLVSFETAAPREGFRRLHNNSNLLGGSSTW